LRIGKSIVIKQIYYAIHKIFRAKNTRVVYNTTQSKTQKVDIKADQKLKIYNNTKLLNVLNIPKSLWTLHPHIPLIVETFIKVKKD